MDWETFQRLPRHPDWRHEYDGEALLLSHRPRSISLQLPTRGVRAAVEDAGPRRAAPLDPGTDRDEVDAFLREFWAEEEPYRCFGPEVAHQVLDSGLRRSWGRVAEPAGAVVRDDDGGVVGVVLLEVGDEADGPPVLTWLSVRFADRRLGVATTLLAAVLRRLAADGVPTLASNVSAANQASVRWHWRRGFVAEPDPWPRPRPQ